VQEEKGSTEPPIAEQNDGTIPGALATGRFVFAESPQQPLKERLAALLVVSASVLWLLVFICCDVTQAALPWCVVILCTALTALAQYLAKPQQYSLAIGYLKNDSPSSLRQSLAVSYAVFSIGLCVWLAYHHSFQLKEPPMTARHQVIDIELVSKADYEDRKDILPSSKEKVSLKERHATAEITQQSITPLSRRLPNTANSQLAKTAIPPAPQHTAKTAASASFAIFPMKISEAPRTSPLAAPPSSPPVRAVQQPVLEEVAPPEMVELTDNQGDKSSESFQSGGRSKGGTGAPSTLVTYLKELHRRIKHAWTPPFGETRSAEILFRLKRNGSLSSIKLMASSGDNDADSEAMHAIATCAPFKALPKDYPADYLDLQYTFNYKADELSEVASGRTE
jgi:TonB family protein